MEASNLGAADGLAPLDWTVVEAQLADLSVHDAHSTLGPPPWHVYQVTPRTATAVGTAEEMPGSTHWQF